MKIKTRTLVEQIRSCPSVYRRTIYFKGEGRNAVISYFKKFKGSKPWCFEITVSGIVPRSESYNEIVEVVLGKVVETDYIPGYYASRKKFKLMRHAAKASERFLLDHLHGKWRELSVKWPWNRKNRFDLHARIVREDGEEVGRAFVRMTNRITDWNGTIREAWAWSIYLDDKHVEGRSDSDSFRKRAMGEVIKRVPMLGGSRGGLLGPKHNERTN